MPTPSPPAPTAPPKAVAFQNLRCRDCGIPLAGTGPFGFCRCCGAPLCPRCASSQELLSETGRVIWIPVLGLLVATLLGLTRGVAARVAFCRSCVGWIYEDGRRVWLRTAVFGLVLGFSVGLAVLALGGMRAAAAAAIVGFTAGFFPSIPAFFVLKYIHNKELRPACPVCGRDVARLELRRMPLLATGGRLVPDFIDCPCGYQGPRIPLDGLWAFVDKNGPRPLDGSPVERMARASWFLRHGGK